MIILFFLYFTTMDDTVAKYLTLLFFILALVAVVLPFQLRGRLLSSPVHINFVTGPLLALFLLVLSSAVPPSIILDGIVGDEQIQPYTIIILFFSLAYMCISLDVTNVFAYLAIKVVKAAGRSAFRLFIFIFLFSSVLTLFTSNDIVILTVTPIICNLAIATKMDPTPLLIAQFFAANIWSVALIIGNPTNVIAGEAYGLGFLEYAQWMAAPAAVGGIASAAVLCGMFWKQIKIQLPEITVEESKYTLHSRPVALFKCILFMLCLLMFSLSDTLGIRLWMICAAAGAVYVVIDIVLDVYEKHNVPTPGLVTMMVIRRLPYTVAPFMVSMFSLVYALEQAGFVSDAAVLMSSVCTSVPISIYFVGYLTGLACSLMNNQPMTILFSRILLHADFAVSTTVRQASVFSLIMGSNFGANFSYVGAMAGLMFLSILRHYNITLPAKTFSYYGFVCMTIVTAVACTVLLLETMI